MNTAPRSLILPSLLLGGRTPYTAVSLSSPPACLHVCLSVCLSTRPSVCLFGMLTRVATPFCGNIGILPRARGPSVSAKNTFKHLHHLQQSTTDRLVLDIYAMTHRCDGTSSTNVHDGLQSSWMGSRKKDPHNYVWAYVLKPVEAFVSDIARTLFQQAAPL